MTSVSDAGGAVTRGSGGDREPDPGLGGLLEELDWRGMLHATTPGLQARLATLQARLAAQGGDQPLIVHCAAGYRSAVAVGILERAGITNVVDFAGGYAAWEEEAVLAGG